MVPSLGALFPSDGEAAERLQSFAGEGRRLLLVEGDLRVAVEVSPPPYDLISDTLDEVVERYRRDSLFPSPP